MAKARGFSRDFGEWLEGVIMPAAHAELKAPAPPAISTEEVLARLVEQMEKRDQAVAGLAAEVAELRKGWLARLFGR